MKTALVTLSIRPSHLFTLTRKIHQEYANRHGLAFECIDEEQFKLRPNIIRKRRVGIHVEKLQIYSLLDTYDRIIYLDGDTLINPECPNLLEVCPVGCWSCFYEDDAPHKWKGIEELESMEARLGKLNVSGKRYFNAGVLVVDREHQKVFRPDKTQIIKGRWPEQTLLNYRVIDYKVPVYELPPTYNFLPFMNGWERQKTRFNNMIVHYAGTGVKDTLATDVEDCLKLWKLNS